jgi:glutaminyl-tRNA synthetase
VRLYDRLFVAEDPDGQAARSDTDITTLLNPGSLEAVPGCKIEPMLAAAAAGSRYQFERLGYFAIDPDSRPGAPVFNRTVSLKDSWAKAAGAPDSART